MQEELEELRAQVKQLAGIALAMEEGAQTTGEDAGDVQLELRAEALALKEQLDAEVKVRPEHTTMHDNT